MAQFVVVAVYDSAVQGYMRPFVAPSAAAAVRSFVDEVNRVAEDNQMNKHPDDFEFRQLADWDDSTGIFESNYRVLVRAKDVKQ